MSFSGEWLALREPADRRARSVSLVGEIAAAIGSGQAGEQALDLATGTGANVRFLMEHVPAVRRWLLVDSDPALLAQLPDRMSAWGLDHGYEAIPDANELFLRRDQDRRVLTTRQIDLRTIEDATIFAGCGLITASALLDLVSEAWLVALTAQCRLRGAAVLFALTYDGRIRCDPPDPGDGTVRDLVNRHQRSEKGFGSALGPDATRVAEKCLTGAGYRVHRAASDWDLPPTMTALQRQLIDGWAEAAMAVASRDTASIEGWRRRRLEYVVDGRSRLIVGHEDLAAWLK